ncbi:hypothetical protein RSA42_06725 [Exiguobacterium indicum]|uniref:hypothetical protein n=1 Tax=Exiguobacterium indicum TaxID=296995 RepID=UPI00073705E2|nr:hypothetical protein [Exiguobacterium indicum]KTR60990.1 hypothetical protein RSA42_06725 [Exiguobacterium indicum]
METKTSTFTATHGVMTQEVGVISGELELRTTCQEDGTLELKIAYVGAIDVYTLPGNYRVHDVRDHDVIHQMLVNVLERT